jgi:hypothetical protein
MAVYEEIIEESWSFFDDPAEPAINSGQRVADDLFFSEEIDARQSRIDMSPDTWDLYDGITAVNMNQYLEDFFEWATSEVAEAKIVLSRPGAEEDWIVDEFVEFHIATPVGEASDLWTFGEATAFVFNKRGINESWFFAEAIQIRPTYRVEVAETWVLIEKLRSTPYKDETSDQWDFIDSASARKALASLAAVSESIFYSESVEVSKSTVPSDSWEFSESICVCGSFSGVSIDSLTLTESASVIFAGVDNVGNNPDQNLGEQSGFSFKRRTRKTIAERWNFVEQIRITDADGKNLDMSDCCVGAIPSTIDWETLTEEEWEALTEQQFEAMTEA